LNEDLVLLLERFDSADAAADHDAAARDVFLGEIQARVLYRTDGRRHPELSEAVEPLGFARVNAVSGDIEIRAFSPETNGILARVPSSDHRNAALAGAEILP